MSLRKDPRSPHWQYDFQINKRRFHGSTHCTTKRDAERFEAKLRASIALGDVDKSPITLDVACAEFWDQSGKHDASSSTTDYQVAKLCSLLGERKLLSELGPKEFNTYIAKRRTEGVGPATINRELEVARRIWKLAAANSHQVPTIGQDRHVEWAALMLDEPQERVRELLPDEERRLFEHLGDDLAAVVEFAMLSGQRKASVITLERSRVDLAGMRATVTMKGSKQHTFPLTARMAEIILERPEVDDCPYVFTYKCRRPSPARKDRPARHKGKRYPFSSKGWSRQWRQALADAEISNFRFHDLRHTRATRLVRATGNLKAVQKLLGHSDISTTARYAHVLDEDLRIAMAAGELRNSPVELLTTPTENGRILGETDALA